MNRVRRKPRLRRGERGITLIETLVAMTLFALLAGILGEALSVTTLRLSGRSDRLDRVERVWTAAGVLRAQLADARAMLVARAAGSGGGRRPVLFEGRPDGATFVGPAPESIAGAGLQLVTIAFDPSAGDLVVRWRRFEGAAAPAPVEGERDTVLIHGIEEASFSYFGSPSPDDSPAWRDDWLGASVLPWLVRIHASSRDGDPLPDFVVAVRTAQGLGAWSKAVSTAP